MYVLINNNGLYVMNLGYNEYSYTKDINNAVKFLTREACLAFLKKYPYLKGAKITTIKMASKLDLNQ